MHLQIDVKKFCSLVNQIFDVNRKIEEDHKAKRNLDRAFRFIDDMEFKVVNPLGEPYDETRTDCEASIAGESTENLFIAEVIKPVIFKIENGSPQIIQKAVVIVEGK